MIIEVTGKDLKVYLINLDRAHERLRRMEVKCAEAGLSFERITAVDGLSLSFPHEAFSARSYRYLHGRKVIPAEVGCYLSHVECARRFLASDASHALILEDDVSFPEDFNQLLSNLVAESQDWDILRLSTVNKGVKFSFRKLGYGRSLAKSFTREKGAGAYVINRKAAVWICGKLLPMRLSYDIAFDLEYLVGLRSVFVEPIPVSQSDERASQIQNDINGSKYSKIRYITVLPYRIWLEFSRVALRVPQYFYLLFLYQPRKAWLKSSFPILAIALVIGELLDHN
jgi:glycosyl transferase family 25